MPLFLAINIPEEAKKEITKQIEHLVKDYPYFRWEDESKYHITLHFFGQKPDADLLTRQIEDAVFDVDSFRLYTSGGDLFMKNSIVLHILFHRNKMLEKLVNQVQEKFQIHDAVKYVPHLTIARYKIPSKQQYLLIKKKVGRLKIDVEFAVSQITLLNSVTESEKPLYETIAQIPLTKKG